MTAYPEIRATAREVRRRIRQDESSPYQVRRKRDGVKGSRGDVVGEQYDFRTMSNMLTQPLGRTQFERLEEGLRTRKPRFVAVIPTFGILFQTRDEVLEEGDQINYKDEWYEVKEINNWDQILHATMVVVE